MRKSKTYRPVSEDLPEPRFFEMGFSLGFEAGRQQGWLEAARTLLLKQATIRFGRSAEALKSRVDKMKDPDDLELLSERLLSVGSWQELLATF